MAPLTSAATGPSATDELLIQVVLDVHHSPRTVQSNWARENAQEVAAAASMGFITTVHQGAFGRSWRATAAGLELAERAQ
jgi:hypothetical protein